MWHWKATQTPETIRSFPFPCRFRLIKPSPIPCEPSPRINKQRTRQVVTPRNLPPRKEAPRILSKPRRAFPPTNAFHISGTPSTLLRTKPLPSFRHRPRQNGASVSARSFARASAPPRSVRAHAESARRDPVSGARSPPRWLSSAWC